METKRTDLAILGAGPGGYVAAIRASKLGIKPVVIEKEHVGGVCLNRGCIPTKALFYDALLIDEIKKANQFGISTSEPKIDFKKIMQRKNNIVNIQRGGIEFHFKKNNVDLVYGKGEIVDSNKILVKINEKDSLEVNAKNIIIATGSSPSQIPPFDFKEEGILTNKEALSLDRVPSSMLIVGGGIIGCEFANIFSSFGTRITIIELLPRILSTEDEEVSSLIEKIFKKKGIEIFTDCGVDEVNKKSGKYVCKIKGGKEITVDKILISVGRRPNSIDIGIEEADIKTEKGYIKVDPYLRSSIENIYAVGDVIGGYQLAHVASAEGKVAAENIAGNEKKMDYKAVPWAIFTNPEIGAVGLTESKAREQNVNVCIGYFPFKSSAKAHIFGETEGFIKIVTDKDSGEILGAHIVGSRASDLIHEVTVAMKGELLVDDIADTIHSHPTLSEAVMEACEDCFGLATHVSK